MPHEAGLIVSGIPPEDVYAMVIALAGTWSALSATFTATRDHPAIERDRRRDVLRRVVQRALVPRR